MSSSTIFFDMGELGKAVEHWKINKGSQVHSYLGKIENINYI
jgi:hypothetical protein